MQLHMHLVKSVFGKSLLAAAALGGFLFFGGASSAQAQERYHRDDDRRIVRYEDRRPHEVIEYRGYNSPRAEYWRHGWRERREAFEHGWFDREGCWHRY